MLENKLGSAGVWTVWHRGTRRSLLSSICHSYDDGSRVYLHFDMKLDAAFASVDNDEGSPVSREFRSSFSERFIVSDVATLSSEAGPKFAALAPSLCGRTPR